MKPPDADDHEIDVGARRLRVTNLNKDLWTETGFTKGDVLAYYQQVAPVLLPHLSDRPLTLHRFPDGVEAAHWYETRCPPHPPWLRVARMHAFRRSGKVVDACVVEDRAGLAWAARVAAVEPAAAADGVVARAGETMGACLNFGRGRKATSA